MIKKHNFKKKFGQNFLTDKNLLNKIVEKSRIEDKNVIEIGPGKGALTKFIIKKAKNVIAYEIDVDLKDELLEIEKINNNFKVVFADFLKVNLNLEEEFHVVANIPYNITSPIIFKILDNDKIKSATLMVQKEVGMRILAKVNTKEYNAFTLIINYYMNVEKITDVNKKLFKPIPKVDSIVIRLERTKNELNADEEKKFINLVKIVFMQRRKTILNNLEKGLGYDKIRIKKWLKNLSINENSRGENLSKDDFLTMVKYFNNL